MQRGKTGHGRGRDASHPRPHAGKPEEIGAAVVCLCSDAAAFVIGHATFVDGAQTA
jgi:hypothetical protein